MDAVKPSIQTPSTVSLHYLEDAKSDLRGVLHGTNQVDQGQVDQALELDGKGYVNLGNFNNTCLGKPSICRNGMTVSLWLRYKSSKARQYFLGTSGSDVRQPGFVVYQDMHRNGTSYIAFSVRTGEHAWTTHVTVPRDTWTHVLFTWSPRDGLSVHTNGTLASRLKEFSQTASLHNSYTSFTLGRANNQYRLSRVTYDELAVWYQVLTDREAKAIYARTSGIDFEALEARSSQGKHLYSRVEKNDFSEITEQQVFVQFSSVQFSSVQFSSVQFSSVQFSSVQFSSVQFSSVQFSSVQFSSVQFSSVQFSSVQFSSVQFSSVVFLTYTSGNSANFKASILS